jgi:phage portal protein BeeE
MSFLEWTGFAKPRDAPKPVIIEAPEEPEVTDNIRDSGQTFFFGAANSGERVDEKSAMQISTVYACVSVGRDSGRSAAASLPVHKRRKRKAEGAGASAVQVALSAT